MHRGSLAWDSVCFVTLCQVGQWIKPRISQLADECFSTEQKQFTLQQSDTETVKCGFSFKVSNYLNLIHRLLFMYLWLHLLKHPPKHFPKRWINNDPYLCIQPCYSSCSCLVFWVIQDGDFYEIPIQFGEEFLLSLQIKLVFPLTWTPKRHDIHWVIIFSCKPRNSGFGLPSNETALSMISSVLGGTELTKCVILFLVLLATQLFIMSAFSSGVSSSFTGLAS